MTSLDDQQTADLPYSDEDLRAAAARLHAGAANDADDRVRPAVQRRWGAQLDMDQVDEACDEVTGLLDRTANLSRWAVDFGADRLEPSEQQLNVGGGPRVRIHFAFAPDMSEADRRDFIAEIAAAVATAS